MDTWQSVKFFSISYVVLLLPYWLMSFNFCDNDIKFKHKNPYYKWSKRILSPTFILSYLILIISFSLFVSYCNNFLPDYYNTKSWSHWLSIVILVLWGGLIVYMLLNIRKHRNKYYTGIKSDKSRLNIIDNEFDKLNKL